MRRTKHNDVSRKCRQMIRRGAVKNKGLVGSIVRLKSEKKSFVSYFFLKKLKI